MAFFLRPPIKCMTNEKFINLAEKCYFSMKFSQCISLSHVYLVDRDQFRSKNSQSFQENWATSMQIFRLLPQAIQKLVRLNRFNYPLNRVKNKLQCLKSIVVSLFILSHSHHRDKMSTISVPLVF